MLIALSDLQGNGCRIAQFGSSPIDQVRTQRRINRGPRSTHVSSPQRRQEHNAIQLNLGTQSENTCEERTDGMASGERGFNRSRPSTWWLVIEQCCCGPIQTPEVATDLDRPRKQPRNGLPLIWQFDDILVRASKNCVAKVLRWPVGQNDCSLISCQRRQDVENGELRHTWQYSDNCVPNLDIAVSPLGTRTK
ncbi:hypothetical protein EB75_09975 [Mycobacterium sp. ST-F2]|nr:hypothetical protein EB75_09975 [Mycobacterium sp. ST-F2]